MTREADVPLWEVLSNEGKCICTIQANNFNLQANGSLFFYRSDGKGCLVPAGAVPSGVWIMVRLAQ